MEVLMYQYFISIPSQEYGKPTEDYFKEYAQYSKVVMVTDSALQEDSYRVLGTYPACLNKNATDWTEYPKFVCGLYYSRDYLLLMEDVIEYCHGRLKFENIRSANV